MRYVLLCCFLRTNDLRYADHQQLYRRVTRQSSKKSRQECVILIGETRNNQIKIHHLGLTRNTLNQEHQSTLREGRF